MSCGASANSISCPTYGESVRPSALWLLSLSCVQRVRDGLVEKALIAVKEDGATSNGRDPATLIQCLAR